MLVQRCKANIFYPSNIYGNIDRWQTFLTEQTYSAKDEFSDHAENEVGPEYVQTEKDHQHHVEEVVAKEGRVVVNGVDPGAVDQPETQQNRNKSDSLISSVPTCVLCN